MSDELIHKSDVLALLNENYYRFSDEDYDKFLLV